jgi:hypothetical protein
LQRFSYVQDNLSARGMSLTEATLTEMDALWNEAKIKDIDK